MTSKPRIIACIRCYENFGRTSFGNVQHQTLGTLYSVPHKHFDSVTWRFACKLRELGFTLPGFDHLEVILTPGLAIISPLQTIFGASVGQNGPLCAEWQASRPACPCCTRLASEKGNVADPDIVPEDHVRCTAACEHVADLPESGHRN